jgi:pyruvate,orthophosphate dikinase
MPKVDRELRRIARTLEKHYRDVQDIEFTIERGKLWMLQTRDAKRTAQAAIRIAVELVKEKLISRPKRCGASRPSTSTIFCTLSSMPPPAPRRSSEMR